MKTLVQPVDIKFVPQVWGAVEKYFARAVATQSDLTLDQVKQKMFLGDWQMLVVTKDNNIIGAAAVNYYNNENDRVAFVTYAGGKFITVPDVLDSLKAIVVANGATCIEGAGSPAISRLWRRHFGFHEKYVVVQLKLEVNND